MVPPDRPSRPWARLLVFAGLTLLISWSYWLAVIASSRGWIAARVPTGPWGSFGPAAAALLTAALFEGSAGPRRILRGLVDWRVRGRWYAVALLGMPAVLLAWVAVEAVLGQLPAAQNLGRFYLLPALALVVLVFGGPLGEEVGWRGYALPLLLGRVRPLAATLVVWALWGLWHVPLFWLPGAAQKGSSMGWFMLMTLCVAFVFTWLYLQTRGSLLLAVLLHDGINTAFMALGAVFPGVEGHPVFGYGLVGTLVAIAVVLVALPASGLRARGAPAAPQAAA